LKTFDTISYLNSKPDIEWKRSGKNIGKLIGLKECPFCNDSSYHLGISTGPATFLSCWACGYHNIFEYLVKVEGSYKKAKQILEQYSLTPDSILEQEEEIEIVRPNSYKLPQEFTELFPTEAKDYLAKRRYDFLTLRKKYGILWSGNFGKNKFRIIIPIREVENGPIVNFVGRDITEKQSIPYLYGPDDNVLVRRGELLMGLDHCNSDKVILVEGPFDQMRIGNNAISILSVNFTKKQLLKLKKFKKFYLMLDNDEPGVRMSKKLESYLTWADEINYVEYDAHDPDSLNDEDIKELKRTIF